MLYKTPKLNVGPQIPPPNFWKPELVPDIVMGSLSVISEVIHILGCLTKIPPSSVSSVCQYLQLFLLDVCSTQSFWLGKVPYMDTSPHTTPTPPPPLWLFLQSAFLSLASTILLILPRQQLLSVVSQALSCSLVPFDSLHGMTCPSTTHNHAGGSWSECSWNSQILICALLWTLAREILSSYSWLM